jgi:hypothetical protein
MQTDLIMNQFSLTRFSISFLTTIALVILLISCNSFKSHPPAFNDGGAAVNIVKNDWQCESVEFENWGDNDLKDSTLTICLINSKSVPSSSADSGYSQMKTIANQIRHSLAKPQLYNSYNVIFVKASGEGFAQARVHSAGANIPLDQLK